MAKSIGGGLGCAEVAEEKTGQYNNENCEGTAESGGRYIKIYNNFEWRNIKRELLTKAETATTDALLLIHHKVPALLGGGEITVHCEGTFGGTVGTGAKDETKQFKGNKGEETKINCEASSSTNSLCKSGELVLGRIPVGRVPGWLWRIVEPIC